MLLPILLPASLLQPALNKYGSAFAKVLACAFGLLAEYNYTDEERLVFEFAVLFYF